MCIQVLAANAVSFTRYWNVFNAQRLFHAIKELQALNEFLADRLRDRVCIPSFDGRGFTIGI